MYYLVPNGEVDKLLESGTISSAVFVGVQITEQIAALTDDPAGYTVLVIAARGDGLCRVMTADRWGHASLPEYLGLLPEGRR